MTVRPIFVYPAAVLRCRATTVTDFGPDLQTLVDDMVETMQAARGVGLAATQVGDTRRVLALEWDGAVDVLVNPEIATFGDVVVEEEGCLSIPGIYADVERPEGVRVTAQDRFGAVRTIEDESFLARILQHEGDHLNGTMFLDHLRGRGKRRAMAQVRDAEWFGQTERTDHLGGQPRYEDR